MSDLFDIMSRIQLINSGLHLVRMTLEQRLDDPDFTQHDAHAMHNAIKIAMETLDAECDNLDRYRVKSKPVGGLTAGQLQELNDASGVLSVISEVVDAAAGITGEAVDTDQPIPFKLAVMLDGNLQRATGDLHTILETVNNIVGVLTRQRRELRAEEVPVEIPVDELGLAA